MKALRKCCSCGLVPWTAFLITTQYTNNGKKQPSIVLPKCFCKGCYSNVKAVLQEHYISAEKPYDEIRVRPYRLAWALSFSIERRSFHNAHPRRPKETLGIARLCKLPHKCLFVSLSRSHQILIAYFFCSSSQIRHLMYASGSEKRPGVSQWRTPLF